LKYKSQELFDKVIQSALYLDNQEYTEVEFALILILFETSVVVEYHSIQYLFQAVKLQGKLTVISVLSL
jgi:hypothetical protein